MYGCPQRWKPYSCVPTRAPRFHLQPLCLWPASCGKTVGNALNTHAVTFMDSVTWAGRPSGRPGLRLAGCARGADAGDESGPLAGATAARSKHDRLIRPGSDHSPRGQAGCWPVRKTTNQVIRLADRARQLGLTYALESGRRQNSARYAEFRRTRTICGRCWSGLREHSPIVGPVPTRRQGVETLGSGCRA